MSQDSLDIESTLNELAARVLVAEPGDADDLRRIRTILDDPRKFESWIPEARRKAVEIVGFIDEAIEGIPGPQILAELNLRVSELQASAEKQEPAAAGDSNAVPHALKETDVENLAGSKIDNPGETPPTSSPAPPSPDGDTQGEASTGLVMIEDDPALMAEFVSETLEHLQAAEESLLILETDPANAEAINRVFRAFHTVKGTAGFVGLDEMQELSHKAENLLDRARGGEVQIVGPYADLALESCDMLKTMVRLVEAREAGGPVVAPAGLDALLGRLTDPEAAVGGRAPRHADEPPGRDVLASEDGVSREENVPAVRREGRGSLAEQQAERNPPASEGGRGTAPPRQASKEASSDSAIRVSTPRLDALMNMVGELVVSHSMVARDVSLMTDPSSPLSRNVSRSGKIVRELQDLTMALRMVPLRNTFQKITRLVRDLSRKSGKAVELHIEGEETEIDRNMVEVLNDPLAHMIRNSVDHGIESSDDRKQAGKSSGGTLWLRAYHSAGNVVIELEDDGRGLDREKIIAKGIERGFVSPGGHLAAAEAFDLIFQPGFSTADSVTEVSGRGVGMDVVRRAIERLRGRIDVGSQPGRGTIFTLRLPLTTAIIDTVVVCVGQQRYLLPAVSIKESFRPRRESVHTVMGRVEMVKLRDDLIPVIRLHRLFGVEGAVVNPTEGLLINVTADGKQCALMVDEVLGQQQIVIKSLGEMLSDVQGLAGGAILGDGRVALILDVLGLVQMSQQSDVYNRGSLPVRSRDGEAAGPETQRRDEILSRDREPGEEPGECIAAGVKESRGKAP